MPLYKVYKTYKDDGREGHQEVIGYTNSEHKAIRICEEGPRYSMDSRSTFDMGYIECNRIPIEWDQIKHPINHTIWGMF